MKRTIGILAVWFLFLASPAFAEEFKDSAAALAVDFPSGWKTGTSNDPTVVLKLEKGKAFFEFAKLDSELSDYYLKARVKEQVDSLRSKGNSLSGDVRTTGIHGVSTAYYTEYESMGDQVYIAFFTYGGMSYAISARGLDDGGFRGVISTIRKPGEKIELPKPKKIKVRKKAAPEPDEELTQIFKDGSDDVLAQAVKNSTPAVEASTPAALGPGVSADANPTWGISGPAQQTPEPSASGQTVERTRNFLAKLLMHDVPGRIPYFPRAPLNLFVWLALIAAWTAGSFWAKGAAAKFPNPKLSPPPKDVPPDFFFPFIISRSSTHKECTYNVLTRQKQLLLASFEYEHELYVAGSIYAGLSFHLFWSLLAFFGRDAAMMDFLLALRGGRLWASAPEIFLAVPFIVGLAMYFNKKQVLQLYDSQSNLLMEGKKETFYCLIRDGKGKEIARIMQKGGLMNRSWDFVDTDNQVVFTVKDDYPSVRIMRKLFGNLGGALRTHYGIFAEERRAGFVFLDPTSGDRFQIHLDFDFARLAHPAQMLTCILYIISKEKDPVYPWPF